VQLFPGAILPLHVFEPRYRELVRDAAAGKELIAPAMLKPGFEADYEGRPPVHTVVGVGRMIARQPLDDGRSNIVLRGVGRARIARELEPERSYRLVMVEPLPDREQAIPPGELEALRVLVEELARRLPSGGETLRALYREQPGPGPLSDALAAALITDPHERQLLLEEAIVVERLRRLNADVGALLSRLSHKAGEVN
jgi:Lon protease-like protein